MIIPNTKFDKKLSQKQFDDLYIEYCDREPFQPIYDTFSNILDTYHVKIIEYCAELFGHTTNGIVSIDDFLYMVSTFEWNSDFITNGILRVFVSSTMWYDLYFSHNLSDDDILEYEEKLLNEEMVNDIELTEYIEKTNQIYDEIIRMQDEYYMKFNEELLPSAYLMGDNFF